jgi:3-isopropylmalate dehydrogenase
MLEWLGHEHRNTEAIAMGDALRTAVSDVLVEGRMLTADLGGSARTDAVAGAIAAAYKMRVPA